MPKTDVMDMVTTLKQRGEAFVLATVVRTVAVTAAKAGAKAVIAPDGSITGGWIGGGCARGAVLKAAQDVLADGQPRLISIQPPSELELNGVAAGETRDGIRFAKNLCPSQGTMDIFVEAVMPQPSLVICGSSPVAVALARLASVMGYAVTACAPQPEQVAFANVDTRIEGYALSVVDQAQRFIVVSVVQCDGLRLVAGLASQSLPNAKAATLNSTPFGYCKQTCAFGNSEARVRNLDVLAATSICSLDTWNTSG